MAELQYFSSKKERLHLFFDKYKHDIFNLVFQQEI